MIVNFLKIEGQSRTLDIINICVEVIQGMVSNDGMSWAINIMIFYINKINKFIFAKTNLGIFMLSIIYFFNR